MATTLKNSANRLNMVDPLPVPLSYGLNSGIFKPRRTATVGAIATMQGIGASLSGLAAGVIVDHFGYSATFLTLGAAALVAVIVFAIWMPETAEQETATSQSGVR